MKARIEHKKQDVWVGVRWKRSKRKLDLMGCSNTHPAATPTLPLHITTAKRF